MTAGTDAEFAGTSRFEVIRRLGAGGMGVVYQVYDRERARAVALKTLRRRDAAALYRFKREFRGLADIAHPNLAALHELVSSGAHSTSTHDSLPADARTASVMRAARRPSANVGRPSRTSPRAVA